MSLNNELSMNLGLSALPLTDDPKLFSELVRVYNAIRNVAYHLDRYTGAIAPNTDDWDQVGADGIKANGLYKVYLPAYEDLVVGNIVSFMDDAGTAKVRKALSATYTCHGFCSVAGLAGDTVEITLNGLFPAFPAATLTTGALYYNSATPGLIGAGGSQVVGFALSDTQLFFNPQL